MMTNMGVVDAALRFAVALGLLAWSYGHVGQPPAETWAWLSWIAGLAFGATALMRFCPVYALIGTDSCAIYVTDPGSDG